MIEGATGHSADEIAYFRRLLDAMFDVNNTRKAEVFAVRVNDAIHLNKNPPRPEGDTEGPGGGGLTLKAAEEALENFVREGWLERSK